MTSRKVVDTIREGRCIRRIHARFAETLCCMEASRCGAGSLEVSVGSLVTEIRWAPVNHFETIATCNVYKDGGFGSSTDPCFCARLSSLCEGHQLVSMFYSIHMTDRLFPNPVWGHKGSSYLSPVLPFFYFYRVLDSAHLNLAECPSCFFAHALALSTARWTKSTKKYSTQIRSYSIVYCLQTRSRYPMQEQDVYRVGEKGSLQDHAVGPARSLANQL